MHLQKIGNVIIVALLFYCFNPAQNRYAQQGQKYSSTWWRLCWLDHWVSVEVRCLCTSLCCLLTCEWVQCFVWGGGGGAVPSLIASTMWHGPVCGISKETIEQATDNWVKPICFLWYADFLDFFFFIYRITFSVQRCNKASWSSLFVSDLKITNFMHALIIIWHVLGELNNIVTLISGK